MKKGIHAAFVCLLLVIGNGGMLAESEVLQVVAGQVVNLSGSPVPGALVASIPINSSGWAGNITWSPTSDTGAFRLRLKPGRYIIRAKHEAMGYADPNVLLASDPDSDFPEVLVGDHDVSGIQVRLGNRGGTIEGDLRDSVTQRAIAGGKITLRDVRHPEAYVELFSDKAGHFQFAVPSKPLRLSATAPGYAITVLDQGNEFTLSGGEHKKVTLELQRR